MKAIIVTLVSLALTLIASSASAGTISIHDQASFLSPGDVSTLQRDTGNWPFDAHLLTENASSFDQLEDDAHAAVTAPTVVAIAIDPGRHKTIVRFGTATGVKTGDYDAIAQAGSADFRAHNLAHGIESILLRARASKEATVALSRSGDTPVVVEHGLTSGAWLLIALGFAAFAAVCAWLYRRSRRDQERFESALNENREETAELRSRNIEESTWADGVRKARPAAGAPPAPRPAPAYVGSNGYTPPITTSTNMNVQASSQNAGFVEGMLVGDMLSRQNSAPVPTIIEREVVREEPSRSSDDGGSSSSYSGGSSSYDSGSSSSDDSGGSSSSWDSGSSSSYDSGGGGGFDSGGGGLDGGGGSSGW